jgi:guanosine-3',5'-bis(diphosphate) 3'-pyrophosphohydrolase
MTQNDSDISLIIRAAHFAAEKHRNQRRKDAEATPYINHPLTLAKILSEEVGIHDPQVLAAAILHDTIEDTETTEAEIREHFGDLITNVVLELTDDKSLPKHERKRLQVQNAPHKSPQAKLVKTADKIANLRDIASTPPATWSLERRQTYFDWAQEVVLALGETNPALRKLFDEACGMRPK